MENTGKHVGYGIRNCTDQRYPRMRTFQLRVAPKKTASSFHAAWNRTGERERPNVPIYRKVEDTEEKEEGKEGRGRRERGRERERDGVADVEGVNNARFTKGRDGRINRRRGATPQPLSKQPPRGSVPSATPRKPLPASCQWRRGLIRIDGNLSTGKFADEDSDYKLQSLETADNVFVEADLSRVAKGAR